MNFQIVYGWFCVGLGVLAFIGGVVDNNMGIDGGSAILGGIMFLVAGWIIVDSQAQVNNLKIEVEDLEEEVADMELDCGR